jgi:16S rRNA processing protein RimM
MGSSPNSSSTVEIGRVSKPHGVRGEVKVRLHWPSSDVLLNVTEVELLRPKTAPLSFTIESARTANQYVLVKFAGIEDRDAALTLNGSTVRIDREALPALEPGEYYLFELIGASVVAPQGDVGTVEDVRTDPSVDTLVIRRTDGKLVEQPLGEQWVDEVDLAARCIRLAGLDGIIE